MCEGEGKRVTQRQKKDREAEQIEKKGRGLIGREKRI